MNAETIQRCLEATFNMDPNIRMRAEMDLKQLLSQPGFLPTLFQLCKQQANPSLAQAAAVYFKNTISNHWDVLAEADRAATKADMMSALGGMPEKVRIQVESGLSKIIAKDYPAKWPEFWPTVNQLISAGGAARLSGLVCTLYYFKSVKYAKKSKRAEFEQLTATIMPHLLALGQAAAAQGAESGALELHYLLKCYYMAVFSQLFDSMKAEGSIIPWMTLFMQIIIAHATAASGPWAACAKWAFKCIHRVGTRYGLDATDKAVKTFAASVCDHILPNVLDQYMELVGAHAMGTARLSAPSLYYVLALFAPAVKKKATWLRLKPHLSSILSSLIFPMLCYSEEDGESWEADPVEFIRTHLDIYGSDANTPRQAASEFLSSLVEHRKGQTLLPMLKFVQGQLTGALSGTAVSNPAAYYGALELMCSLTDACLEVKSPVRGSLEEFFSSYIPPALAADAMYVRFAAAKLVQLYDDLEYSSNDLLGQIYHGLMQNATKSEDNLPMQVASMLAIRPLMQYEHMQALITPHVGSWMTRMLEVTEELDTDLVTNFMEEFVEQFGDELIPVTAQIAQTLVNSFVRVMSEVPASHGDDQEVEATDKLFTAMGFIRTLSSLVLNLDASPHICRQLEPIILPVLKEVFKANMMDVYEEVFELLDCMMYATKEVSADFWSLFPHFCTLLTGQIEYLQEINPIMHSYFKYGHASFAVNPELHTYFTQLITHLLTATDPSLADGKKAALDWCVSLLLCSTNLGSLLDGLYGLLKAQPALASDKMVPLKVLIMETFLAGLMNYPLETLAWFDSAQVGTHFFTTWFANLPAFSRVCDKTIQVAALSKLMMLPLDQVPVGLQAQWPLLVKTMLEVFRSLPAAENKRDLYRKLYGLDDDDDDETGDDGTQPDMGALDDDDVEEEDSEYADYLQRSYADYAGDDDDDDEGEEGFEDDDVDELVEDVFDDTPLTDIDPYITFKQTMATLAQANPQLYQFWMGQFTPEDQQHMQELYKRADENQGRLDEIKRLEADRAAKQQAIAANI